MTAPPTLYVPQSSAVFPEQPLSHKHWVDLFGATKPDPGHGALLGVQHEPREIAKVCYDAGWQDAFNLTVEVAIVLAESQGYDRAIHVNLDGTEDLGAFQLDSIHGYKEEDCYDLRKAAALAFDLWVSTGSDFGDWAAYLTSVYLHDSYLGRAVRGVGNYLADEMLGWPVKPRADGTPYEHHFRSPVLDFWHRNAGQLHFVEEAQKALSATALTSALKITTAKIDLGKAKTAAKQPLPG